MRLIDADKYWKELLSAYDDVSMEFEVLDRQPLVSAIPIQEGATNGDMIKAMFPDLEFTRGDYGIFACFMKMNNDVGFASLYETWWNAPYKGGCNLSEKSTGSEKEFYDLAIKALKQDSIIDKVKQAREEIENLTPWDEGLVEMHEVLAVLDELISEVEE